MVNRLFKDKPEHAPYREAARRRYHVPNKVEIDEGAAVLLAPQDNGAYVRAWVWVGNDDLQPTR